MVFRYRENELLDHPYTDHRNTFRDTLHFKNSVNSLKISSHFRVIAASSMQDFNERLQRQF